MLSMRKWFDVPFTIPYVPWFLSTMLHTFLMCMLLAQ